MCNETHNTHDKDTWTMHDEHCGGVSSTCKGMADEAHNAVTEGERYATCMAGGYLCAQQKGHATRDDTVRAGYVHG